MPRIYDSASNPLDFCNDCFPDEATAEEEYGNVAKTGEGPDGRGNCYSYDDDHPPYDGEDYNCQACGKRLRRQDDYLHCGGGPPYDAATATGMYDRD